MSDGSVVLLLEQVRLGTASRAQQELFGRYFHRLVALARVKLGEGPTAWHDEEDVALSAMKSFFIRARDGQFPHLNDPGELWPLLVTITLRKVSNARRHQFAERRDIRRQLPLEDVLSQSLTPEFADRVLEAGNELLESLDNPQLRKIAQMKLECFTNAEIAAEIGRSPKTVEWKLRLIRKALSRSLEDAP